MNCSERWWGCTLSLSLCRRIGEDNEAHLHQLGRRLLEHLSVHQHIPSFDRPLDLQTRHRGRVSDQQRTKRVRKLDT